MKKTNLFTVGGAAINGFVQGAMDAVKLYLMIEQMQKDAAYKDKVLQNEQTKIDIDKKFKEEQLNLDKQKTEAALALNTNTIESYNKTKEILSEISANINDKELVQSKIVELNAFNPTAAQNVNNILSKQGDFSLTVNDIDSGNKIIQTVSIINKTNGDFKTFKVFEIPKGLDPNKMDNKVSGKSSDWEKRLEDLSKTYATVSSLKVNQPIPENVLKNNPELTVLLGNNNNVLTPEDKMQVLDKTKSNLIAAIITVMENKSFDATTKKFASNLANAHFGTTNINELKKLYNKNTNLNSNDDITKADAILKKYLK